jgi:arylsulfatase A-like enzyme
MKNTLKGIKIISITLNVLCLLLLSMQSMAQIKPNILWVTIEDTSPHFIGAYGDKYARTPNIDGLAKKGVMFSAAFSTNTVCSPSRTTIITGVRTYAAATGNHRSSVPTPDFMHGFPYYMQQVGYYTSNNVKTDYNLKNKKSFIAEAWNENSEQAGWWNRKPGQPFFAVFNYNDSHQSRTMTFPYSEYEKLILNELREDERIGDNEFEMPPFYRDTPEMRKQFARVYNSLKYTDNKVGEILDRLKKDNLADSTIVFFYGDHGEGIPRGKTNGINLGYRVPFIIYFPPMYAHLSPWGKGGVVTDELIDFEDLGPTMISLVGGQVPDYMKGRILMGTKRSAKADHLVFSSDRSDEAPEMVRSVTDGRFMYSRNYLAFMPQARKISYMDQGDIKKIMKKDFAEGLMNPLQSSLMEPRPAEFLFDVEKDKWETVNLAENPKYYKVLDKMRKQLDAEVHESRDVMFLPEYEINLLKGTTAYEFRLSENRYPLKKIYDAAKLSGFRGKDVAAQQVKLLKDADKIVRYWAAIGLRSQPAELLQYYKQPLLDAMKDAYAPVVVTISAICSDVFANQTAQENVRKYIKGENEDLAFMASNYVVYMKDQTPFASTKKAQPIENKKAKAQKKP